MTEVVFLINSFNYL